MRARTSAVVIGAMSFERTASGNSMPSRRQKSVRNTRFQQARLRIRGASSARPIFGMGASKARQFSDGRQVRRAANLKKLPTASSDPVLSNDETMAAYAPGGTRSSPSAKAR